MTSDAGVPGAPRFDVVLRGYDRRQVDEHVDRLQRVLSRMRADLDIARSQPMPSVSPARPVEARRPRPTPRPRASDPDTIGTFTDRMESILAEAEAEAAEIRRNAHVAARAETEGVRSQVADLVRQRDAVLGELTRMRSQLEGMLAAPTTQMPAREPAAWSSGGRHESDGHQPHTPHGARPPQPAPEPPRPAANPPSPTAPPSTNRPPSAPPPPNKPGPATAAPSSGTPSSGTPSSGMPTSSKPGPATAAPSSGAPSSGKPPSATNGVPTPAAPPTGSAAAEPAPSRSREQAVPPSAAGPAPAVKTAPEKATALTPKPPEPAAPAQPARPEREAGKAAHRLPTGAYPAVAESGSSSLRPRTEPEIEPADLFRPKAEGRQPEPRTTAVPATDGGAPGGDRTTVVPSVRAGGDEEQAEQKPPEQAGAAEATTMVGAVRPDSPTVLAPTPGTVTRPDEKDGATNGDAQKGSTRSGSPSRSA